MPLVLTGAGTITGVPKTTTIYTSGSGTYTPPSGCVAIFVRLVGGGGSGASYAADGTTGGNTTFGTLTGGGGSGGFGGGQSGAGGSASGGDVNIPGEYGGAVASSSTNTQAGGNGGTSFFGGAGVGGQIGGAGTTASTNSGSGGGGSGNISSIARSGGGAGGYVEKLYTSLSASYSYAVGSGATGPSTCGSGAAGIIIIQEFYA